jgi:hypothetical protein
MLAKRFCYFLTLIVLGLVALPVTPSAAENADAMCARDCYANYNKRTSPLPDKKICGCRSPQVKVSKLDDMTGQSCDNVDPVEFCNAWCDARGGADPAGCKRNNCGAPDDKAPNCCQVNKTETDGCECQVWACWKDSEQAFPANCKAPDGGANYCIANPGAFQGGGIGV